MKVNADFSKSVLLHGDEIDWTETRMQGVKRRMLDRIGAESGHATSIVSYDPNSKFSSHVHTGGEEFVVLDGVFQDEHGDFPVGSYIRNPPESSHTPGSEDGCVIFVKLWQFDPDDRRHVRIRFDKMDAVADRDRPGVAIIPLYRDERENVRIETWDAGAEIVIDDDGGAELLVLEGGFEESGDLLRKLSWLRVPVGSKIRAKAGASGARVWIKTGHLRFADRGAASAA